MPSSSGSSGFSGAGKERPTPARDSDLQGNGAESKSLAGVALALFGIGLVAMLFGDFDMVCCGVLFVFIGVVLGSYEVFSRMFRPSPQRMG